MSEPNYDILDTIQNEVVELLSSSSDLEGIGISAQCTDYESQMADGLATNGVFILVSIPEANFRPVQSPRVILDPIQVSITVTVARGESNRTSHGASAWAILCGQNLVMRNIPSCNRPLVFSDSSDMKLRHNESTDSATITMTTSTAFQAKF